LEIVEAAARQGIIELAHGIEGAIPQADHYYGQWEVAVCRQAHVQIRIPLSVTETCNIFPSWRKP
jgi:hypothetical protein